MDRPFDSKTQMSPTAENVPLEEKNHQPVNGRPIENSCQAESSRQAENRRPGENPRPADNSTFWQRSPFVYVHETGTNRELGIFALQDLRRGQCIIRESPAFSCIHWNKGRRTAAEEWLKLTHIQRDNLRQWFCKVRDVAHGGNDTFKTRDRKRLEEFISNYAFADPRGEKALIYKWASTINHACQSCANAQFWVDSQHPNDIDVRLVRGVKVGEEIFICYNRPNLKFGCAVCGDRPSLKRGKIWAFIAKLWEGRQRIIPSGIKGATSRCNLKGKGRAKTVRGAKPAEDAMSTITEESTPMGIESTEVAVS